MNVVELVRKQRQNFKTNLRAIVSLGAHEETLVMAAFEKATGDAVLYVHEKENKHE